MDNPAKDGHELILRQFEEAFDQTVDERADAELARDYYDGKQLTTEEQEALRLRKQPIVISNRIKPKIDALIGFEKKQRRDPCAYPRTPQHEQEAQGATDALRFVCDQQRFPMIRSEVSEYVLIEGAAAATVTVKQDKKGRIDPSLACVPWDRFYRDPHSRRRDFSDAAYLGEVLWMDEAEALALFNGKEDVLEGCYTDTSTEGETFDDRPKLKWSDKKRKRVRVLKHRYLQDGQWHIAIVCKGGFLRDPQVSPFLNEDGEPECDLIAVSAYVDRENNRYGAVRMMISPQDEINKRRSKALHLLNSRQIITEIGAVADREQARREANRPDGLIEVTPGMRFEYADPQGLVAGQFQLLQESKQEIDASGVNPAIEGDLKASSGRAQELITQAGLAEQAIVFDALRDWSWRMYKAMWHRIRQYWTEERWVRVTDDANNLKWVGINQADQMTGQVARPIAELEVDLILEDGPDTITIQAEQFDKLVELKKADPMAIPTSAIIEASDLRNKDKLLEHTQNGGVPPQVAQQMQEMQAQLQECQQALQQAEMKAGTEKQEAQAVYKQVQADIKVARAELAQKEAEIRTMLAEHALGQQQEGEEKQAKGDSIGEAAVNLAATQSLGPVVQQFAQAMEQVQKVMPVVAQLAQQQAMPRRKQGRMARQEDGSYSFEVDES